MRWTLMTVMCCLGAAVTAPVGAQDETARTDAVKIEFETRMADDQPKAEDITPENASQIASRMFWFVQIRPPWQPPDDMPEEVYRKAYMAKCAEIGRQRVAVIERLLECGAEDDKMPHLFGERIDIIATTLGEPERGLAIADEYLEREPAGQFAGKAWAARTEIIVRQAMKLEPADHYGALAAIEKMRVTGYEPEYAAFQLMLVANNAEYKGDFELQRHALTRVLQHFPESQFGPIASGKLDRDQWIGKPFELEFEDVLSGKQISMADYRGKIVIVDFWATWCGPCVAEIPKLRDVYEKYKRRGVEVIGVSLDYHADAVRHFAEQQPLPWPQRVDEKSLLSEFTSRWGIHAIPAVFIIDQEGNLYSNDARGKEVEIIEELLAATDEVVEARTD